MENNVLPIKVTTQTPLNQVLLDLGFTTKKVEIQSGIYSSGLKDNSHGKKVYDAYGKFIAIMTAGNCWDYLQEKNLIVFDQQH